MVASHYTIYMLDTELKYKGIVEDFNEDKEDTEKFILRKNNPEFAFENVKNYEMYIRKARNKPEWGKSLNVLVSDLGVIENINYSFVLFLEIENKHFAITGGSGYHVIEKYKRFNFGIDLLSRLIEQNDDVIKRVNDRYLTGNVIGSNSQFLGNVTINSEKNFNNFFNEVYVGLPSDRIQEKLGIELKTKKKDYSFLAKDSIKLGKAITLNELDNLLASIVQLLKEPGYSINQFYALNKNDRRIDILNEKLVEEFKRKIKVTKESHLNIIPFYSVCDKYYIEINGNYKTIYNDESDILLILGNEISPDKENSDLLKIFTKTMLTGEIEGEVIDRKNLFNHFDIKLYYDDNTYWLMEGNWYLIEKEFMEDINKYFINKVVNAYDFNFNLPQINQWTNDISEGEFNFKHNQEKSVFVLDKIFMEYIEICDLLIENEENNELYFVHVKKGLNNDTRVLSNQILQSMQIIQDAIDDENVLGNYYNSIINKLKNTDKEGNLTQLAISANKFKKKFPNYNDFKNKVLNSKIIFVFAFRPLPSHDLNSPETIQSTAAKLSMIDLVNNKKNYDFPLEFLKISS